MGRFIGDLLFGGFVIVLAVIFIRDQENATKLVGGLAGTYTGSVKELASIRAS